MKVNEGEVPQYYIEQSHQPIIDPEEFDKVQAQSLPHRLRRLRQLLRSQGLAFQQQVPLRCLAVQ